MKTKAARLNQKGKEKKRQYRPPRVRSQPLEINDGFQTQCTTPVDEDTPECSPFA